VVPSGLICPFFNAPLDSRLGGDGDDFILLVIGEMPSADGLEGVEPSDLRIAAREPAAGSR
jgi:hypothetical protein